MLIKYFYIFLLNSSFINIENIWNVFVSEIDAFAYTSILVTCSPVPLVYVCVWTNAILSQSVCACVFSHIWLCNPKDCSPPGSSVHGIRQARILEWVAISSSSGSSWPRDWTHHSCIGKQSAEPLGKPTVTGGPVVKDSKTFTAGVHSIPDWGTKNPTCRVAEKEKKIWVIYMNHLYDLGFPGGSDGLQCGRPGFDPWVGKIPWRRKWQPTPVLLPGKFHGRRSLVGYSPWGSQRVGRDWATSLSLFTLVTVVSR